MNNLREIIPTNIVKLRKQQGFTQLDLAKKVNYSDKAVSRWEKGEVLPDVETLQSISQALNVTIAYLLEPHDEVKKDEINVYKKNQTAFQTLIVLAVWTIATIIFVLTKLYIDVAYWQIFVWAVPASCIVLSYFNRKKKNRLMSLIVNSVFTWSFLASIYLQFLNYKAWLVFIIGVPIQAAVIVAYYTKRKVK